ncbi:MAG TPA: hypothetical protein VMD98_14760 [Bryocella sp.]|nr:hypothetical protein [Bryocella sp.]
MKLGLRVSVVVLLFTLAITVEAGAQAAPGNSGAGDSENLHGVVPVTLAKALDSKKAKEGDPVMAKTAVTMKFPNGLTVPAGSDVIGHVTEAKARSKGDPESSLGIVFDKIDVGGGKSLAMKGALQAVGPNPKAGSGPDTGSMMGGNNMRTGDGATSAAGSGIGLQADKPGAVILNPKSTGVVGIKNLELSGDSVLTSSGKEVKLDAGSQIMIHAQ